MGAWVIGFFGFAVLYAALGTALVVAMARVLGRALRGPGVAVAFTTLTFVFLTQHPFPDPETLSCPSPSGIPQVQPFNFWPTVVRLWSSGAPATEWARNMMIVSTVMNVVVCMAIGLALARSGTRLRSALAFGMGLTLAVELTQLTGIWGLYPCAYREFNVDDLMTNVLGVLLGFVAARRSRRVGAPLRP
ncbi:VanZ family protein [Rubellimicrobium aerolatum]|uniref:VanZ family protein n=1 Tax=Rubellimicrobium aerolatum TaxID=490979 RepID=A0ABW0SAM8_9RHOB|nr:VanZ family protein [Rubellimicrobium aerolatum]MBP1806060.1 hypothetical protein [Rubellimicrobium aerolatum]